MSADKGPLTQAEVQRFNDLLVRHVQMKLDLPASGAVGLMYAALVNLGQYGQLTAARNVRGAIERLEESEEAES